MAETWYLLYSGSSVDGRGDGQYVGRTCNASVAARHYREISKNPYSTGYVAVITDEEVMQCSFWWRVYNPRSKKSNAPNDPISELKDAIQQQEANS